MSVAWITNSVIVALLLVLSAALARAAGFRAQREAIGEMPTALVAVAGAVAEGKLDIMPEVLVTGGGSALDGLAATLMRALVDGKVSLPAPREGGS